MSIRFEKVNHIYSENTPFAYQALQDINLSIAQGKITAVSKTDKTLSKISFILNTSYL